MPRKRFRTPGIWSDCGDAGTHRVSSGNSGQLPELQLLVTTGMRNLSIDMNAAKAQGITVAGLECWDIHGRTDLGFDSGSGQKPDPRKSIHAGGWLA